MAAYEVSYHIREELESLSNSEAEEVAPIIERVSASDANRAISKVVNQLKDEGYIRTKNEIRVLEAKVVA